MQQQEKLFWTWLDAHKPDPKQNAFETEIREFACRFMSTGQYLEFETLLSEHELYLLKTAFAGCMNGEFTMKKEELFLDLINSYEAISRKNLNHNVINKALDTDDTDKSLMKKCTWIAHHCLETNDSQRVYHWFSPCRTEKIPLSVLLKLSVVLEIPIELLLQNPNDALPISTRKRRPSCKNRVKEYADAHPEASFAKIAEELHLTEQTVRRHLKMEKEKQGYEKGDCYGNED